VLQVPYPDPLFELEPSEKKRKIIHAQGDYAKLWVKLYEDLVQFDEITLSHRYPTRIHDRYVLDPSPIPRFDVPKLNQAKAPVFFGAGREKKIYAVPPHTSAEPLSFEDRPFRVESFADRTGRRRSCRRCCSAESYLDEFLTETGEKVFQCSDLAYCNRQLDRQLAHVRSAPAEEQR
jgi:alpha-D-ribose 1-methylphosphonate 5-phosphate C-P lyase